MPTRVALDEYAMVVESMMLPTCTDEWRCCRIYVITPLIPTGTFRAAPRANAGDNDGTD
jgi:hypothetical protein